jgi:hypothetical protein
MFCFALGLPCTLSCEKLKNARDREARELFTKKKVVLKIYISFSFSTLVVTYIFVHIQHHESNCFSCIYSLN